MRPRLIEMEDGSAVPPGDYEVVTTLIRVYPAPESRTEHQQPPIEVVVVRPRAVLDLQVHIQGDPEKVAESVKKTVKEARRGDQR